MARADRLQELPEEELLRRARRGAASDDAREAASELLGRYRGRVFAWCFRMVRERDRALELAQEVLLSAWRNLDSFGGRSAFGSWLFMIARNRCLTELRRPALLADEETDPDDVAAATITHDRRLEAEQDQDQALELIRAVLEPVEQEAIWLRCYEGMPVDEITRVLRIPESSGARAVIQRARRKLRAALQEREARGGGETPSGGDR